MRKHVAAHRKRDCAMRFVPCDVPGCAATVRACDLARHKEGGAPLFYSAHLVPPCRAAYLRAQLAAKAAARGWKPAELSEGNEAACPHGCGAAVLKADLPAHCAHACPQRPTTCAVPGCGAVVPHADMARHLARDCAGHAARRALGAKGARQQEMTRCAMCEAPVLRVALKRHKKTLCPYRLVRCRYEDCGQLVGFCLQEQHFADGSCGSAERKRTAALAEASRARSRARLKAGMKTALAAATFAGAAARAFEAREPEHERGLRERIEREHG